MPQVAAPVLVGERGLGRERGTTRAARGVPQARAPALARERMQGKERGTRATRGERKLAGSNVGTRVLVQALVRQLGQALAPVARVVRTLRVASRRATDSSKVGVATVAVVAVVVAAW